MENAASNRKKIMIRYGLLLFVALTLFFLAMQAFGLAHNYWLRALNFVILFSILNAAVRHFKKLSGASYYDDFFDFFRAGVTTAFIGIMPFAIFMMIYLDQINPVFLQEMRDIEKLSPYLSAWSAGMLILIEGMGSALVGSYILVHLLKAKTVERPTVG